MTDTKEAIHTAINEDQPSDYQLPKTWPAIVAMLFTKAGLGAIFLLLLIPVYLDLKASNERFAKLAEANITAMQALTSKIEKSHENVGTMQETIRRIETELSHKP
jgi:predicted nuclease with TOPRIM domain